MLKDKRIFIVEDNIQNRVIFQMTLMRHGALVNFDRCGRDTLFRLRNAVGVDLIVLDLMLVDGITGFELCDQIHADQQFNQIPIIAVSAMDAAIAVPKVRAHGFNAFIAKPIDPARFPRQIAAIMAGETIWEMAGRTFV